MNITVITQPEFEPVTLSQVYRQLRMDFVAEGSPSEESHPLDAMLSANITTARQQVENITRRALMRQKIRLSGGTSYWSELGYWRPHLRLWRPPFISLASVNYYDGDSTLQAVSVADYFVTDEPIPSLYLRDGYSLPTTASRPDAIRIEYWAGYLGEGSPPTTQAEQAANVPQALKDAILIGVELLQGDANPADREGLERLHAALLSAYIVRMTP